jgi:hypothetical protein
MLQVRQSLADGCFHKSAIALYFAQKHRALDRGNAEVRHRVLAGFLVKSALGFLFPEERRNLVAYDLKDEVSSHSNDQLMTS